MCFNATQYVWITFEDMRLSVRAITRDIVKFDTIVFITLFFSFSFKKTGRRIGMHRGVVVGRWGRCWWW